MTTTTGYAMLMLELGWRKATRNPLFYSKPYRNKRPLALAHQFAFLTSPPLYSMDMKTPILVVDDYKTMVRIIRNLLTQLGFDDIDDASDGSEALHRMTSKRYGLIISDWNMEPMNGLDFLKAIRSGNSDNARVPFIMVTAESKQSSVQEAKEAGVNNYIVKPFSADTLRSKLDSVLG